MAGLACLTVIAAGSCDEIASRNIGITLIVSILLSECYGPNHRLSLSAKVHRADARSVRRPTPQRRCLGSKAPLYPSRQRLGVRATIATDCTVRDGRA